MQDNGNKTRPASGSLFQRKTKRNGVQWYARLRIPDGDRMRETRELIGPHWSKKSTPPAGHYTKRTAERWLRERLSELDRDGHKKRRDAETVLFRTVAEAWFEHKRDVAKRRLATLSDYRSMLDNPKGILAAFGDRPLHEISQREAEDWRDKIAGNGSNRTANKYLTVLHGIFVFAVRRYGLPSNPTDGIEKLPNRPTRKGNPFSPEELAALVRAAEARAKEATDAVDRYMAEQDAAFYVVNAGAGLRTSEMIGLRWRDVDYLGSRLTIERTLDEGGNVGPPKSGKARVVPLADGVAQALAKLQERGWYTADEDPVFVSWRSWERVSAMADDEDWSPEQDEVLVASPLDRRSLRDRFNADVAAAGLKRRTLYDLRHTFGSIAIRQLDPRELQEVMGHSELKTTEIYMSYLPRGDIAKRLSAAFEVEPVLVELERESVAVMDAERAHS